MDFVFTPGVSLQQWLNNTNHHSPIRITSVEKRTMKQMNIQSIILVISSAVLIFFVALEWKRDGSNGALNLLDIQDADRDLKSETV